MEGGEMERDVGTEILQNPLAFFLDLFLGIIEARDKQGRDLEPNLGLVLQVLQGIEYRLQLATTDLSVKFLGETLEVDVGRVHVTVKFLTGLGADLPRGHRHRLNPPFMA